MTTESSDNYLTVDASPREPRDKNVEETSQNVQKESETSEIPERDASSTYKINSNKKTKSKTKKINNQAYANVINICNSNGIHIGSNITINNQNPRVREESENVIKTEAIEALLNSTKPASTEHILLVSTYIGEGWRSLPRKLDYVEAQIDQFFETHIFKGVKEVVYQILLDWIQNEADNATIGKLCCTLWASKHKTVVQKMCENIKT